MDITLWHESLENKLARIEMENINLQLDNQDLKN